ncbi:PucR family transcriptional regulator [Nocardiopsis potens]|uniref:PucR family transcriptional regulator n=1 Tax=Nocardiopsis potens TaxID=1246458 RepID=UPI0003480EC7|nr:PucR family transcriptional regulator [Nocardiopsis potens]
MDTERRRAVADLLQGRRGELAATAVRAVRAEVPAYRRLDGEQIRDVAAISSWTLSRVTDAWARGDRLTEQDLARFRAIGAARAEDGRPVAAVLRAYRVGAGAAVDAVAQVCGDRLTAGDMAALARTVLHAIDDLSEAISGGHASARERLAADPGRALRDLVDDLVDGRHSSAGALADRGRELGVDLPAEPLLLVAEAAGPGAPLGRTALAELAADLAGPGAGPLATLRGRRAVLLLRADGRPGAAEAARARGLRGCAVRLDSPAGAADGYRLASHALDAAPEHAFADRAVLADADAHLLALLRARPGADPAAVARTALGALTEPDNRHLLDGLAAFLSTGSATAAAGLLHLHPQTLRYRLRRASELTGRDPRTPWDRLVLDVARHLVPQRAGG